MFKKLLKIIGSFFLVVFVLLACVAIWFGFNASKYEEVAKPYLQKNMPIFASWDFDKFRPLLSPESLKKFETERGQKIYKMFSKLGKLKSFEDPQFKVAKKGVSVGEGTYDLVNFTMLGHFDTGDAVFTITLAKHDDSYMFHHIKINSDVFIE